LGFGLVFIKPVENYKRVMEMYFSVCIGGCMCTGFSKLVEKQVFEKLPKTLKKTC